ncbi:MAG: sigma-54 interaction domain-containing protein [Betaproteobacteria bacterium]|jgi:DNA-binding NtrC family response regulator|nr:sigma-54-dependent Fis family transcriptional regulator [Rhodocyclaceae bacterium]MCA3136060.1 sigma-54-dependent Fis family transcriptional regulator [Rhodocyclaceae bacterium]MCA3141034.1 sigma-54-dependent Fis family transcriptional regulator [Rhodocyclaceae bacterium]MCA3146170.1 sigma-54-dependent Fis family transcriptional regulator [Rhodocyclaceae bacterium]MCE2898285.1 sigma-54 dependent transcriptional regulator [Betaproteobacteria bacterium]
MDILTELNLIGQSPAFLRALDLLQRFADCDATVLLEGETGTGKEIAARAIHNLSPRRDLPFVPVNCGALPDALLESELFGHERGAFTDARESRQGLVASAAGGTFFLDEVEAMSPRAQVVLLRFLQDHVYRPVGGRGFTVSRVRVIAASNADLKELAARGQFRLDLLYRLGVLSVVLPPLRERQGDVELLAEAFLDRLSLQYRRQPVRLHPDSLDWMQRYPWPGNVRELESLVLREFLLSNGPDLRFEPPAIMKVDSTPGAFGTDLTLGFSQTKAEAVRRFECTYLDALLMRARGNMSLAARLAQQDRGALNRLVRKHGIKPENYRRPPFSAR